MGTAERIRFCRVSVGKSAQQVASSLGLNDAWYRDLEANDGELTSTLTLFQAVQLASLLGVRLNYVVAEMQPSIRISLLDLPSRDTLRTKECRSKSSRIALDGKLNGFCNHRSRQPRSSRLCSCKILSCALGIDWLSLAPEDNAH
jgi:transcriptional regulator with XRE-family HTH domain